MRFLALLLGMVMGCHSSLAQQRQAAVWHYGIWNKLDFNTTPVKVSRSPWWNDNGAAAICNSSGRLQFYASGNQIFDRQDSLIAQLQYMFPPNLTYGQWGGNVIIPFQHDLNRYSYFNIRSYDGSNEIRCELYQFEVDMRKRNGSGGLDTMKTKIIGDSLGTQLACALHANGKDTWLIGRKWRSDSLVAWLVQDTGIAQTVYSKLGSPTRIPDIAVDPRLGYDSQIKTSPNSEMLLIPRRTVKYPIHELYRFNRETGQVYGRIGIRDTTKAPPFFLNAFSDGAFSPDSKVLYVGTGTRTKISISNEGPGHIWQFSLDNQDSLSIAQSRIYLGLFGRGVPNKPEPSPFFPRFQLAMDGKIYVSPGVVSDTLLSIIHCPNNLGQTAQLRFREIILYGSNGAYFPTLNQTFVRNAGIFQLQANKRSICQGDTLELSAYGAGTEHFTWSVSPALPQGVKVDTLTWQKISTQNIPPGSYTFRCVGTSRCNDVLDKSMVVNVRPVPAKPVLVGTPPFAGTMKASLCKGDSLSIRVQNPATEYLWNTGDSTQTIEAKGKETADTSTYYLKVKNEYGCESPVSDTVTLVFKPVNSSINLSTSPSTSSGGQPLALCIGDSLEITASGAAFYQWSDGIKTSSRKLTGSGSVLLFGYDTSGCGASAADSIRFRTYPNPTPVFLRQAQGDTVLTLSTMLNRNYCVAGLPGSTFSFTVQGGSLIDSSEDCATINWLPGNIQRSLSVTETRQEANCQGTASQILLYRPNLQIPNLLTPNGDGMNDVFEIQDLDFYASHHLQIFDRWGKKVLDTTAYKKDWKGEAGVYFYNLVVDGKQNSGWVDVEK